ncbi:hypothetical protein D3C86_1870140 [compost metagenome]
MPAGFEHQALTDPVEFPQKMEPALHHTVALEERPATCDYAYGISAGVGVDTEKSFTHKGSRAIVTAPIWLFHYPPSARFPAGWHFLIRPVKIRRASSGSSMVG